MRIHYNVPGKKRKELAQTIAKWLEADCRYKGVPTCAYEVDYFTIDKEGNLLFDDMADSEVIERLLEHLYDEGFESDISEYDSEQQEPVISEEEPMEDCPPDYLTPPNSHRAKRWGLRWRFPLIRWRSEILRTFWMPRGAL